MPRRGSATTPDAMEFLTMISGPKVDVYVGEHKKHYNLPKLLLCHYSDFFDCCFNGNFAEAQSQKLELPDDLVEEFEILLEYMLRGGSVKSIKFTEVLRTPFRDFTGGAAVERCMNFIRYADKYNLAAAAEVVYEPFKEALQHSYREGKPIKSICKPRAPRISPSDIELIYGVMPAGSRLRSLAAQGALSFTGMQAGYLKQEREVGGFAAELLVQIRASIKTDTKWTDPIVGVQRK